MRAEQLAAAAVAQHEAGAVARAALRDAVGVGEGEKNTNTVAQRAQVPRCARDDTVFREPIRLGAHAARSVAIQLGARRERDRRILARQHGQTKPDVGVDRTGGRAEDVALAQQRRQTARDT